MKDKVEMWIRDNLCIYADNYSSTLNEKENSYDYEYRGSGYGYDFSDAYMERRRRNDLSWDYGYLLDPGYVCGYGHLYDPGYGYGDGHGYSSNAGNGIGSCAVSKCDVFGELISWVNGKKGL